MAHRNAVIAIDDIIASLDLGEADLWEDGLPAAYDVAVAGATALLRRDFVVFVESTFTFVPSDDRPPVTHPEQLRRLVNAAEAVTASWIVVRLTTEADELARRREATGRIDPAVVRWTSTLHGDWVLGAGSHELDTSTVSHEEAAALLDALLRAEEY